jgi:hypothetical protein
MDVLLKEDVAIVNEAERVARRLEHRRTVDDCSRRVIGGRAADLLLAR